MAHAGENDALQLGVLGLQEPSNNWLTKAQNQEVEISATYKCFLCINSALSPKECAQHTFSHALKWRFF